MIDYKLFVKKDGGEDLEVTVTQKPESGPPKIGETITGTTTTNEYGTKLKREFIGAGGPAPSGGSGGGGGNNDAAIRRAVAFKGAVEIVSKVVLDNQQRDACVEPIRALTDAFDDILREQDIAPPKEEIKVHPVDEPTAGPLNVTPVPPTPQQLDSNSDDIPF